MAGIWGDRVVCSSELAFGVTASFTTPAESPHEVHFILSIWIAAVVAAQTGDQAADSPQPATKTCPDKPVVLSTDCCGQHPDHRKLPMPPKSETHTVEWICGTRTSVAQISIMPARQQTKAKYSFEIVVDRLELNGMSVSQETLAEAKAALSQFNSVGKSIGPCYVPGGPIALIAGHGIEGHGYVPRTARIELRWVKSTELKGRLQTGATAICWRPAFARAGAAQKGDAMKQFALTLPLIMLAACDSSPDVKMKDAKPSEVAQEMRDAAGTSFVRPGQWEQTVTLLNIEAPGMPPEARQMMQKAMDKAQVHNVCLSKEQAERPREDFFTGADQNCTYEHFNWGDGKIDIKLICKHPQATTTMAMTGTYSPDNYVLTMNSTNNAAGPAGDMVMTMKVDAKRVGECDGQEKVQVGN